MTPPRIDTAQLFEIEGGQAVRLPEAYRLEGAEVIVERVGDGVLLLPRTDGWKNLLSSLGKSGGFQFGRDQGEEQERDWGDFQECRMTDDPQACICRILAAEGQFDADPTLDYKRQRLQKQEEVGNYELDEEVVEWLRERTARASWEKFDAAMDLVPDVPPLPGDELP